MLQQDKDIVLAIFSSRDMHNIFPYTIGSSLSISTIVDKLYVLKPDKKAQALERFWQVGYSGIWLIILLRLEQNKEVRNYVKAKFSEDLKASCYKRSLKIPWHEISTNHQDTLNQQDKDKSLFWSLSAYTFIPNSSKGAVSFILTTTVKFGSKTYKDCL